MADMREHPGQRVAFPPQTDLGLADLMEAPVSPARRAWYGRLARVFPKSKSPVCRQAVNADEPPPIILGLAGGWTPWSSRVEKTVSQRAARGGQAARQIREASPHSSDRGARR